MLQRAASNAYSWWWASHIRTKQSKWLDCNLQGRSTLITEMEETVKEMLKLIEPDADSFAKRAELYFKRRPELISYVEDAFKAYRALADRYDHISGELHKANHTIATAFPERVQYAMLEDDDNFPKAITPVDPSKINRRTVEGLMNKRRESELGIDKSQKKSSASPVDKEKAQEDINKLQKEILVLQTEKEFIKSSYESGIAKYWEIEKKIMEMHEEVCCLQDEFDTSTVIEDDEARALMTATVLKSCEDTIVKLQEQRKESLEQANIESERTKIAKEKLKDLKGEYCQSEMENTEISNENSGMSFTAETMEEEIHSLNKVRTELQSIREKLKEHFEMNTENSVIEIAEKIEELANKVITLELTVSSQGEQIDQLTLENNELEKNLQLLEEEKVSSMNDSEALSKRLKETEEELSKVQAIERIVQDEEINFRQNFAEAWHGLNDISEKLQSHKTQENVCTEDASQEEEASSFNIEPHSERKDREVNKIHDIEEDVTKEIHATEELSYCPEDPSQTEGSQHKSSPENIEDPKKENALGKKDSSNADLCIHLTSNEEIILDGKEDTLNLQQLILTGVEGTENILLAEYTSILQNYKETKIRLSEVEKKNEEYLQETMALIDKLKNDIAMKDEEIRLLRQPMAPVKNPSFTLHSPSVKDSWHGQQKPEITSNSSRITDISNLQDSEMPEDINIESTAKGDSSVEFTELRSPPEEGTNVQCIDEPKIITPIERKFRRDIDTLLDERLEFWLKFSTSFHHIQELKAKYEDLQTDIGKLKDNKTPEVTNIDTGDQSGKPDSSQITTSLRELKSELQVWSEQGALLRGELQSRFSSLCDMQDEISSIVKVNSESREALFTPYQAASFQGEVTNMKQENNKVASELQVGLDQVRGLQAEIEEQLSKLYENFEPFVSKRCPNDDLEHSLSRNTVPLRDFLFGVKPKKPSILARIQHSKLRAGRRRVGDRYLIYQ
ncbi:unnamed protein product [Musa acuminata subsp. malaccensis]|uniref:(wild Malaysian banana) hypothetical protein n=1 Tax=Musa acuminata subsp. malaccensis TaxID=214687 RepID=A0A8D7AP37_MUSAM|nr:unnamed protein product [Musa acuminata subsp. malaccensis]